jgi:hypothetical protein
VKFGLAFTAAAGVEGDTTVTTQMSWLSAWTVQRPSRPPSARLNSWKSRGTNSAATPGTLVEDAHRPRCVPLR